MSETFEPGSLRGFTLHISTSVTSDTRDAVYAAINALTEAQLAKIQSGGYHNSVRSVS